MLYYGHTQGRTASGAILRSTGRLMGALAGIPRPSLVVARIRRLLAGIVADFRPVTEAVSLSRPGLRMRLIVENADTSVVSPKTRRR